MVRDILVPMKGDHEQQSVMKTLNEQSTLVQVDIVTSHGESEK